MTRIEALWLEAKEHAKGKPIEPDGYRLVRIGVATPFDLYAGIDACSCVLLALGTKRKPPTANLGSSAIDYFRQQRSDKSWLMVLRLKQEGLETVFGRLCQDLIDATASVSDEPALIALFMDRLNLWRKLFQMGGSGLLEKHEIRGLIAELIVFEQLLCEGQYAPEEVTNGWVGPLGADQDFLFSKQAYEVKSLSVESESITISSLEQLAPSSPLKLVTIRFRDATANEAIAVSLNSMTAKIEGAIASHPAALQQFRDRLLEARYIEHDFYDTVLFEPTEQVAYEVNESFPMLTHSTVPSAVSTASYTIQIEAIRQHQIKSTT